MQTSATTNPEPYCAELYNARELPYGFFSFDLPQLFGQGFPVFFDINLSADDVQSFYEYVQEGLYYDSNTRYSLELSYWFVLFAMGTKQQLYSSMCNFTKYLITRKQAKLLQHVGLAAHARLSLASAT